MNIRRKKQSGSFFAEIGAVIASISILSLVGSTYMDSISGRAQVSESFILMQPIINNVNSFYSQHGLIGGTTANYNSIDVFDNETGTNVPQPYAGRFIQNVESMTNGVVFAQMNVQHLNTTGTTTSTTTTTGTTTTNGSETAGRVGNVQSAIQGEYVIMVPFLIGDNTSGDDPGDHTTLRWACVTTIDANPPTGTTIAPITATQMNEQYFYAPGCVVISNNQAACLDPTGSVNTFNSTVECSNPYTTPRNYNTSLFDIVSGITSSNTGTTSGTTSGTTTGTTTGS